MSLIASKKYAAFLYPNISYQFSIVDFTHPYILYFPFIGIALGGVILWIWGNYLNRKSDDASSNPIPIQNIGISILIISIALGVFWKFEDPKIETRYKIFESCEYKLSDLSYRGCRCLADNLINSNSPHVPLSFLWSIPASSSDIVDVFSNLESRHLSLMPTEAQEEYRTVKATIYDQCLAQQN